MAPGHSGQPVGVLGGIVDHQYRILDPEGGEAATEHRRPVPGRYHHGHRRPVGIGLTGTETHRMGHARFDQPSSQLLGLMRPLHGTGHQRHQGVDAAAGQCQQPTGMTTGQDRPVPEGADRPVEYQAESRRKSVHRARPPSTGITAPVTPPLSGPASHTRAAATSSAVRRRWTGCWRAKS